MKNVIVTTNLPKEGFAQLGADYHVIFPKKEISIGGVYFQVVTDETTSGKIYNYTEAEYLVKSNKEVTTNDNRIPK